jgi:DNA-directed RNA polymerase omega subunit
VSGTASAPEGITNPPIDELLERTQSKYALVIIAAKRARQINAYYSSSARACWSTSARSWKPHLKRSRCR